MTVLYLILFVSMCISVVVCTIRIFICRAAQNIKGDKGTDYRQHKHNKIYFNMLVSLILFVLCAMVASAGLGL